ncbi:hypothetical protein PYW08_013833 [Mythimna loreyi]|uniref:Uncharacterized protein n=1 Tax=Mythimna loreyi TaxID=667449 RepID=A0ACC2R896_9NEOP|nr:hypothetical protein PYW08_013833 [Mythimna loreyi]
MEQYSIIFTLYFLILTQYMPHIDTSRPTFRPTRLVSYSLPQKRQFKKALGFNEDVYLNFTELTDKYKYPTEVHTVTTDDGYILNVFRILPKCSDGGKPYPVFMLHGIFDTADMWIATGTRTGLGYVLASNCYDVWAGNHRGNFYSRRHVKLDPNQDPEYWNFTFDEHGYFDIPAMIDYVLRATGHTKLFYMGHSQGTTDYFVMNSLRPEYNDKVRVGIMIAPVAWMRHFNNPLALIAAQHYEAIKAFIDNAGLNEIFGREHIVHHVVEFVCELEARLCEVLLSLATGYKSGTIPLKDLSVAMSHVFSGTSIKNIAHFAQLVLSKNFQRYNEGIEGNIKRYGTRKPPQYDVTRVSSPVVLISGQSDSLSSLKDVDILVSKLPNLVENYVVPRSYWSHHNHIWGSNAPELVYSKVLDYLNKYKD